MGLRKKASLVLVNQGRHHCSCTTEVTWNEGIFRFCKRFYQKVTRRFVQLWITLIICFFLHRALLALFGHFFLSFEKKTGLPFPDVLLLFLFLVIEFCYFQIGSKRSEVDTDMLVNKLQRLEAQSNESDFCRPHLYTCSTFQWVRLLQPPSLQRKPIPISPIGLLGTHSNHYQI